MNSNQNQSFNLKDLIKLENIPADILESINNNQPIDLGIEENDLFIKKKNSSITIDKEDDIITEEERLKNIEALKKRFNAKKEELANSRKNKNQKEDNQIKMLKENPLFKNLGNLGSLNSPEAKKIIDEMASKMCTNSKQKKAMKKQMEKLISKMNSSTL